MVQRIRKAVFPVGGLGTRFLPATKSIPKEMLPVVDKPLIQYVVEEAHAAGIEEFIFVTGRGKSVIEDHFDYSYELDSTLNKLQKHDFLASIRAPILSPGQIVYTRQQEPLGLGHAIWCARHLIGHEPFAILLADDFIMHHSASCLRQMVDAYEGFDRPTNLVAAQEVSTAETYKYGILDVLNMSGSLLSARTVVEKPKKNPPSNMAVVGRYILQPTILNHLAKQHEKMGEIELTDAIAKDISDTPLAGYLFEGRRFDCGSKSGFIAANLAAALDQDDLSEELRAMLPSIIGGGL